MKKLIKKILKIPFNLLEYLSYKFKRWAFEGKNFIEFDLFVSDRKKYKEIVKKLKKEN